MLMLVFVAQDCYKQHKTCSAGLINAETYVQVRVCDLAKWLL
jgi:hypothetical protein